MSVSSQLAAQTIDPGIDATPTATPASVSASDDKSAPDTYVAYRVKLINGGGSDLNDIRISGTMSGTSGVELSTVNFDVIPLGVFTCPDLTNATATTGPTISCNAGTFTLIKGESLTLPVVAKLPKIRNNADSYKLTFTLRFREGVGSGNTNSDGELIRHATTSVELNTSTAEAVVPLQKGAKFFTGKKGVPQVTDAVATTVNAPALTSGNYAVANIVESPVTGACPVPTSSCTDTVNISILDGSTVVEFKPASVSNALTQYLLITLRRDASAFKGGPNNVPVYYDYPNTGFQTVDPCPNQVDPLAGDLERCVYDRRVFKKNDPEVTSDPELLGDLQIRILAKKNGLFAW